MAASGNSASSPRHKTSYTIPCSSAFRDAVTAAAEKRGLNAADLARAIMLALPADVIDAAEDPGDPAPQDREAVVLQSGANKGKPWRRKPRLQVRLPKGYNPVQLRKALNIALKIDAGSLRLDLEKASSPSRDQEAGRYRAQLDRFRAALAVAVGELLPHAVRTRDEALFVLGFPPGSRPSAEMVKARFRQLATIHHPDSDTGDTQRMAQLNQAMSYMRGSMR